MIGSSINACFQCGYCLQSNPFHKLLFSHKVSMIVLNLYRKKGDMKLVKSGGSRGASKGLPGGRPHRLGDFVADGSEVSSHIDGDSLIEKKVALRITISMQPDIVALQTWHSSISFTTSSSASANCFAKGCTKESVEEKFKTLPARMHLFWQVLRPSREQGRSCCLCCQSPSPPQSNDVPSLEKCAQTK